LKYKVCEATSSVLPGGKKEFDALKRIEEYQDAATEKTIQG